MALPKSVDMSVHDMAGAARQVLGRRSRHHPQTVLMAERILVKLQREIECDYLVTWSPLIAPWG
jgi:hypothetical protein